MNEDRYRQIDAAKGSLTPEEIALGWHFCAEWDGLLIGPGWGELAACSCFESTDPRDRLCRNERDRQTAEMMEMHDGPRVHSDLDIPPQT